MTKVFLQTYGCQMNEYDSNRMHDLLHKTMKAQKTADVQEADIVLINTCSVREKPEHKLYSELGRLRKLKTKNPDLIIGVGGCVAAQEGAVIKQRAPFVDLIFGPQTLHRLPQMIAERKQNSKAVIDISFPEIEKFDHLPKPRAEGPTAYVSIQEGCSKYCSYCIVPYTRGEEIDRPFDDVITECAILAEQGVKEITLLGQNVNDYRGKQHDGKTADLALLIFYIAEIDGIERIRFTTSHPQAFSENLIQAYKDVPKLANHLHLPVQSGSDRILKLMKRGYTRETFINKINQLRAVRPDISISSDFIVGFPDEQDSDFQDTLELVKAIQFDNSYSFIYSKRPGTPAASLADDVPLETKKARLSELQACLNQSAAQISQQMLGTTQNILVTGPLKKTH